MLACKKLPISLKQIEDVVNSIEVSVYDRQQKEINSKDIGDLVMEALRGLNHVAYVRFASYYREFRDVNDFIEVAREVKPPSRQRHKRR
jgi:transcriptional repressor NrdR